jgi:hypothetical protein
LVSSDGVQQPTVTAKEYQKLQYIQVILDGIHSFQDEFASTRFETLAAKGIHLDRRINWNSVSNYLAPEVVLVTATSPDDRKGPMEGVWEFPVYAITMSGNTINLQKPFEPLVASGVERANHDVYDALNLIETAISRLDESRKENAMRQFQPIKRILVKGLKSAQSQV